MNVFRILAPVALLVAFATLAVTSMRDESITGDEVAHLPAGYTYVKTGDFRLNPQHPPLIKALAGLPLLALDLKPVEDVPGWSKTKEWVFGRNFIFENRVPQREIVFLGRLPMVGVGLLGGLVLFLWARRLWGHWPGVFVLFLYVFCPNMLGHAPLVTTDVGVAVFSVMTMWQLWLFGRTGGLRHAIGCGFALGLTLLAKYSGVVTAGVVATLLVAMVLGNVERKRVALAGLLIAAIPLLMITVGFGFPYGLANYHHGFTIIHADANPYWEAFLWGQYSKTGFHSYYVLAQLWKTPIPVLILFAIALLLIDFGDRTALFGWACILLPIAAFHFAAMVRPASIGLRHVLPAFPFIFLACGAVAARMATQPRWRQAAFAALGVWYLVGTVRAYPYFIPYFNELAGGPGGGARYLDDSNIEWGQDFWRLKHYVDTVGAAETRVTAFRPVKLRYYGIDSPSLGFRDVVWPQDGLTYVVGASTLNRNSLYNKFPGVRFHWLERYEPIDTIGWSLYVYRFSTDPNDAGKPGVFYIPRNRWYADAIGSLREILQRSPQFTPARDVLAEVYASRAQWLARQGDADGALLDAASALLLGPQVAAYRSAFRETVETMGGQVAIDEGTPASVYYEEAFALGDQQKTGESLLAFLKCRKRDPHHLGATFNLGQLYARLGLIGLAEAEWKRSLEIEPGYAPALTSLAQARRLKAAQTTTGQNGS